MKRLLRSYTSFNKTERAGLVGLLVILLVLIITRICLSHFVSVKSDDLNRQALMEKWKGIKQNKFITDPVKQTIAPSQKTIQPIDNQSENINNDTYQLFNFDPNTLDSQGFINLGLKPKTIAILLRWRSKGKIFRKKEDLRQVYTLTHDDYQRLEPYVQLPANHAGGKLNLNTADSAALIALNGIGPKLAHKILEYRKKYGPFTAYDQLYEVYRFPDSVFQQLSSKLVIN